MMKKVIYYFSGTGNSRYALETFLQEYEVNAKAVSIEDANVIDAIKEHQEIIFSYPVQYSTLPKILRDFVTEHQDLWQDKKVFVIATMGLFSGDGAGVLARLLQKHGAQIIGGLHLKMPDSIGDEKALKRPLEENQKLVEQAKVKIKNAVTNMKAGNPPREGIGFLHRMAGLFGQRLYFGYKTKNYTDKLKIDSERCIGCGKCRAVCPQNCISKGTPFTVQQEHCLHCGNCHEICPVDAVEKRG